MSTQAGPGRALQLGRAWRPGLSSALGKPGCGFFTSSLGREHRGLRGLEGSGEVRAAFGLLAPYKECPLPQEALPPRL